ncbi:MAG: hypothetical protein A3F47_01115 [Candidatus Staskawiczbacteria bacterium RIFCSPHIGHO2_12_FULL_38_11]|uniref:Uncharacterized protein n=1 Tax=Candidatus Staskawiczbacteria bacterium RIFCSPHIGHO2_12_FULL_38_11 TaxID=1802209 RepID=A0A1G2I543_9BACT|nr:MAG: hypothetical protein A3F47_01115 [Candidatus Staskawiczbacteria bacterium RIFCSPHIGHO2_12_FULL_38_11]
MGSHKKHLVYFVLIAIVILSIVALVFSYFFQAQKIAELQKQVAAQKTNTKVVNFLNLFIDKVLKTDKEVSFEDRLKLENAIRDINDPELLAKWEQFTGGTNEAEIQKGVKDLLEALAHKIAY